MENYNKIKELIDQEGYNYSTGGYVAELDQKLERIFGRITVAADKNENRTREIPVFLQRFITLIYAVLQLAIINIVLYSLTVASYDNWLLIISCNLFWTVSLFINNFCSFKKEVTFKTHFVRFIKYYLLFCLIYLSALAVEKIDFSPSYLFLVFAFLFLILIVYRKAFFILREIFGLETVRVAKAIIVGKDLNFEKLRRANQTQYSDISFLGYFQNEEEFSPNRLGNLDDMFNYIQSTPVDEIYCALSQLTEKQIKRIIQFADKNLIRVKLIPDFKNIYGRAMTVENSATIPMINYRKSPLENDISLRSKRYFDVFFSLLVILFILTWLTPLIYLINLFDSKGPVFFKQLRHGHNKKTFLCYKFRTMKKNKEADTKMCTQNDSRITRLGKFMRITSIDELPQFINVLLGDMSVVGPRPHMKVHTFDFEDKVEKYSVRHLVKPGITGLAQIKGYRGEIIEPSDIINRTRFDIFYLEKWSLPMDIKIVYETVINALLGDKKAY